MGEHAPFVSGFLSFTCLERVHAGHAHPYLYLERASLLTSPYLRQLGSRLPLWILLCMLGMPDKSKVTYDGTSIYDGIMLKLRKKLSMVA